MSEEQQENGNSSGDVPEIELIIKVCRRYFSLSFEAKKKNNGCDFCVNLKRCSKNISHKKLKSYIVCGLR